MPRRLVFIFYVLILTACQSSNGSASQPTPTADVPAFQTSAVGTVFADVTQAAPMATPAPSLTPTAASTPEPPPVHPTEKPTPEPSTLYSALQSVLVVETLEPFEGHALSKMTGWKDGLYDLEWMDPQHLLVRTKVRLNEYGDLFAYPAVLNLETNKIWLPEISTDMVGSTGSLFLYWPYWSQKLNRLISPNLLSDGDVIELYDPDGNLVQSYPFQLTTVWPGVSPSGTRAMANNVWLDLTTGKTVAFTDWDWAMNDLTPRRVVWSPDELSVLACCHLYGNATTGQSFRFDTSETFFDFTNGRWMVNQTYFIPIQGSSRTNYVPAFAPAKQTILNVNKLAGIPQLQSDQSRNDCFDWSPSPDERHLLIACTDGSYLVDLLTFTRQAYPFHFQVMSPPQIWSPNGKFALIPTSDPPSYSSYILSVASKKLIPLPEGYNNHCDWDPTNNSLLCLSWDGQTNSIFDAQTGMITNSLALPPSGEVVGWSPDRNYAAIARSEYDGGYSLWQIDYPTLQNLKQLTPTLHPTDDKSWITNTVWSPDGAFLAFSFGTDIYIVDTQVKP
jgi:hypothetical protein